VTKLVGAARPGAERRTFQAIRPPSGFLETSMRREIINIRADKNLLRQLQTAGRVWDLERGGLYDARCGVVNIWCSPADKPACRVGPTDARNGYHLRTHVDGTDARRAEQTPFISQVVDLQGFWIRTRNALSRVSSVKCCHLRNPGRLAWHDRTPVGCGVQPKRLVKVREK
jgi:hypothetical protein